jgi:hypothetical protein
LQTVIERIERLERAGAGSGAAAPAPTPAPSAPAPSAPDPPEPSAKPRAKPSLGALRRESPRAPVETPAPPVAPAADPEPSSSDAGAVPDLDDVIVAWGAIVPDLSPATRSAVQNAQPVRFDGDVLVFGVAPELLGAARERFKREADTVRDALAGRLGRRFKFNLVSAPELSLSSSATPEPDRSSGGTAPDDAAERAPAPGVSSGAASAAGQTDDDEEAGFAPEELVDAPPDLDAAPVSRLRSELGATVVEELPRES